MIGESWVQHCADTAPPCPKCGEQLQYETETGIYWCRNMCEDKEDEEDEL